MRRPVRVTAHIMRLRAGGKNAGPQRWYKLPPKKFGRMQCAPTLKPNAPTLKPNAPTLKPSATTLR